MSLVFPVAYLVFAPATCGLTVPDTFKLPLHIVTYRLVAPLILSSMSASCESSVILELKGEHASVRSHTGWIIEFPRELLDSTSVLRHALSEDTETDTVPLVVPEELLHSWLQWRTAQISNSWDSSSVANAPQIVQFLQVRSVKLLLKNLCSF